MNLKTYAVLYLSILAATSAPAQSIQPADLVKHYTRYPVQNGWHQVDVVLNGSNLRWTNSAGVSWGLSFSNGVLQTQSDCPYGIQPVGISSVVLANGSPQVRGLTFMSDYYKAAMALDPTYNKMVPLRDAIYRKYDFTLALSGPAISGTTPYEILFDTGSWDTCIPYGAINTNNITVLQKNTTDGWGFPADLVQGTLSVASADGTTNYTLTNFVFFARLNALDDRTATTGNSIMGAFPSLCPWTLRPSFPFALAQKYSPTNNIGLGIASESLQDFQLSWANFKSYLQIGPDPQLTTNLNWRSDLPPWTSTGNYTGYCPYRVPGFGITLSFTNPVPDIVVTGLTATVDTGAPDLTLKLATNNPQRTPTYSAYFNTNGAAWWPGTAYATNALALTAGQNVKVYFTSDTGKTVYYSFACVDDYSSPPAPGNATVGDWTSSVPWSVTTDTPATRINLGNSVYFFCPVYFWDVSNDRVGVSDFFGWRDTNAPTPNPMTFAVPPVANSPTSIFMSATTATEADTPPVSYYFENTTNAANSGWISSTVWTNTGLTPGTVYGYRVKARDAVSNETAWSSIVKAASRTRPKFSSFSVNGTALGLAVTNGTPSGGWTLLQSTNLRLPVSQWQTNCTGTYDANGRWITNFLNTATNRMEFFILK